MMKIKQEVKGLRKVDIEGLPNLLKKNLERIRKKPIKEFINQLKEQSFYQVECPKCKISNRKWVDSGENPYSCPISMMETGGNRIYKVFYFCRLCKISWKG